MPTSTAIDPIKISASASSAEATWKVRWVRHLVRDTVLVAGGISDFTATFLASLTCTRYWSHAGLAQGASLPGGKLDWAQASLLGALLLIGGFASRGVYDRSTLLRPHVFGRKACKTWLVWSGFIAFFGKFGRLDFALTLSHAALLCILAGAGIMLGRRLLRWVIALEPVASHLRERILFIGWTAESGRLAEAVWGNPSEPYDVVGFVELPSGAHQLAPCANIPCLGDLTDLLRLFESEHISGVFLTDVNAPAREIDEIATACEKEYVDFKIIPSYFPILVSAMHVDNVGGTPVMGVDRLPLNRLEYRALKRGFDLVGASIGLVLSLPIIALFAAIVYAESPGPVFYRQKRIGRKGKPFAMIKIRSMRVDAEKNGKVGWTTKDDPRRLKIGALMRKWNIDEIPQFWNVLRGDMSLVGPRPERPELISNFKHEIAHYNARHSIRPGVSGWAQVNGLRGDTDLTERINFDIHYIEHWNLLFDLKIMALTFFKRANAC